MSNRFEQREMRPCISQQIEILPRRPLNRAETKQRKNDAPYCFHQKGVLCGCPDAFMPGEIGMNVLAAVSSARGSDRFNVKFLEMSDICRRDPPRRLFECICLEDASNREDLFDLGRGKLRYMGGGIGLLRNETLRLQLNDRFANRGETRADLLGQLTFNETFAGVEIPRHDCLPDSVSNSPAQR